MFKGIKKQVLIMDNLHKLKLQAKRVRYATGLEVIINNEKEATVKISNKHPDDEKERYQQNVCEQITQIVNILSSPVSLGEGSQRKIECVYDMKAFEGFIIFTFEIWV